MKRLRLFYDFNINTTRLVFCSDGARVFKKIREKLGKIFKNSKFILDRFHGFQKINKAFPKYKTQQEKRNYFKNLFYLGKFKKLINFEPITTKQKEMKNYFINNKEGILNQNKYFNLGCSTEAQVSHFKSLFGNGKKGFTKDNFNKIMILAEAKINGFDLINYIKNRPNKIDQTFIHINQNINVENSLNF
jgi:hypothetical protein